MKLLKSLASGKQQIFVSERCKLGLSNVFERYLMNNYVNNPIMFIRNVNPTFVIGCNQNINLEINKLKNKNVDIIRSSSGTKSAFIDDNTLVVGFIGNQCKHKSFNIINNSSILIDAIYKVYGLTTIQHKSTNLLIDNNKMAYGSYKYYDLNGQIYGLNRFSLCLDSNDDFKYQLIDNFIKKYPPKFSNKITIDNHDLTKGIRHGMSFGLSQRSFKDTPERMNLYEEINIIDIDDKDMLEIPEVKHMFDIRNSYIWSNSDIPLYTNEYHTSFSWGNIDIYINVINEYIVDVKVYTDSVNVNLPNIIRNILLNKKFNKIELLETFNEIMRQEIINDSGDFGMLCILDDFMKWLLSNIDNEI